MNGLNGVEIRPSIVQNICGAGKGIEGMCEGAEEGNEGVLEVLVWFIMHHFQKS
jgi:hypothetical protein